MQINFILKKTALHEINCLRINTYLALDEKADKNINDLVKICTCVQFGFNKLNVTSISSNETKMMTVIGYT